MPNIAIRTPADCPPGSLEARMNLEGITVAREICKKLDVEIPISPHL